MSIYKTGSNEPDNNHSPPEGTLQTISRYMISPLFVLLTKSRLHKTFTPDGKDKVHVPRDYRVYAGRVEDLSDLFNALTKLTTQSSSALVSGSLSQRGLEALGIRDIDEISSNHSAQSIPRNNVTFEDAATQILIFDIDAWESGAEINYGSEESVRSSVSRYVAQQLPPAFHDRSYIIKLSQSAGMNGLNVLSCHLFFILEEPCRLAEIKLGVKALHKRGLAQNIDLSLYRPAQLIFTSNPEFRGVEDPVKCDRVILVNRAVERVYLEPVDPPASRPAEPLRYAEVAPRDAGTIAQSSTSPLTPAQEDEARALVDELCFLSYEEIDQWLGEQDSITDDPAALETFSQGVDQLAQQTDGRYMSAFTLTSQIAWRYTLRCLNPQTIYRGVHHACVQNGVFSDHDEPKVMAQILTPLIQATIARHAQMSRDQSESAQETQYEYEVKKDARGFHKRSAEILKTLNCYCFKQMKTLKIVRLDRSGEASGGQSELIGVSPNEMWSMLSEVSWFSHVKSKVKGSSKLHPEPIALPHTVSKRYSSIAKFLPLIKAIQSMPLLDKSGKLKRIESGYDPDEYILVELSDAFEENKECLKVGEVTLEQARDALSRLLRLFRDFPLGQNVIIAVAALMTVILAPMMSCRPLLLICANMRGSGKTLIAQIIATISTGRLDCSLIPWVTKADEFDKLLQSKMMTSPSIVVIDNAVGSVGSSMLDSLITSGSSYAEFRPLGKSEVVKVQNRSTILITGNNLSLKGDGDRRALCVNMETELEKPEERDDFEIHDIRAHALKHAAEYWRDVLTVLNAYQQAPEEEKAKTRASVKSTGSFQEWSACVQEPLYWLCHKLDPETQYDVWKISQSQLSSETKDELTLVLEALGMFQMRLGEGQWWKSRDLLNMLNAFGMPESRLLRDVLPTYSYETSVKLGRFLQRYKNKIQGAYKCEHRVRCKLNEYRIVSDKPLPIPEPLGPSNITPVEDL